MSPRIELEPIGVGIDCDADETILEAGFRQGWNLVHGCREGQCSACKAFLLEGDVTHRPFSSFALAESEESQGYALLCRAMPDSDLVVELLHHDPDGLRLAHPIVEGTATVAGLQACTHDIVRLVLEVDGPDGFAFTPGQYVDLHVPGTDGEHRSYSMANLPGDGRIELLIKRYPGGRFSSLVDPDAPVLSVGERLGFTGPYGALQIAPGDAPALLVAGGSGLAPVLAILRELAAARDARPVRFVYGARTQDDLFDLDVIAELGEALPDFAFVPVLSDADGEDGWTGETGMAHEAVGRLLRAEPQLDGWQAALCGPPPMIDATTDLLLDGFGVEPGAIRADRFTIAGAAVGNSA